jgi:hypothetical protein
MNLTEKQIELTDGLDGREFISIDIKHSGIIFDKLKSEILQALKLKELVERDLYIAIKAESLVMSHPQKWRITMTLIQEYRKLLEESKK